MKCDILLLVNCICKKEDIFSFNCILALALRFLERMKGANIMEITRFKRDDGMWNFIKSDGSFLSNEFFKLAYSFSMGWQ